MVESTSGAGSYALTTTLAQASAPFQPIPVGSGPELVAIVAGEFTGDGHTDLAVVNPGRTATTARCRFSWATGTAPSSPPGHLRGGVAPVAIATGDFNGDGRTDLAVVNSQ